VFLAPRDAWWSATWWLGHDEVEIYVNIGTVAEFAEDRVVSVDLDLDVIRLLDGSCEIIDQDEFAEHQVAFGYPDDVIAHAEAAAVEVLDLLQRRVPPFDDATVQAWVATVS
jgi:protein associated with RNAse G/E